MHVTDLTAWVATADTGEMPAADAVVRKAYTAATEVVAGAEDTRRLRFTISTASTDRDRDQINPAGWRLDAYRQNPVVLWAHSYHDLPVAKATSIGIEAGRLVAEAEFVPAGISPFADTVYQLVKGGFLSATSVGFRPLKWMRNEERGGYDIEEADLMEFSIVPVPSNPEALVEARAAGVDIEPVTAWAKATLTATAGEGVWLKRGLAEAVLTIVEHAKATNDAVIASQARQDAVEQPESVDPPSGDGQTDKAADGQQTVNSGHLEMSLPRNPGSANVKLGGSDITKLVQRIELSADATGMPKCVLHILPKGIGVVSDADIQQVAAAPLNTSKRGRVLSAANETKLRQAVTMLSAVLSQVEQQPVEDSADSLDTTPPAQAEKQAAPDPPAESEPEPLGAVCVLADAADLPARTNHDTNADALTSADLAQLMDAIRAEVRERVQAHSMAITGHLPD